MNGCAAAAVGKAMVVARVIGGHAGHRVTESIRSANNSDVLFINPFEFGALSGLFRFPKSTTQLQKQIEIQNEIKNNGNL